MPHHLILVVGALALADPVASAAPPAISPMASGASATGSPIMPLAEAAIRFGRRESAMVADLSPDGSHIVYLAAGPGSTTQARVMDLASHTETGLISSGGKPEQLHYCAYATARTVICSFGGNVHFNDLVIGASRTIAVDVNTGKLQSMGVKASDADFDINQFDGRVIDWLPEEAGAVLMQRHYVKGHGPSSGMGVDRIGVEPLSVRRLLSPREDVHSYLTDGHGTVRMLVLEQSDSDGVLTGKTSYRYRKVGQGNWLELGPQSDDFAPQQVEWASDSLYFLDHLDGRAALYRMTLDGSGTKTLVASHPKVDIDGIITIAPGDPVIGYRYTDDQQRVVYFDSAFAKLGRALAKALPTAPLIRFAGASKDQRKLLVFANGDRDAGSFYLLDRATNKLDEILPSRQFLSGVTLAPVVAVTLTARDGTAIPAYVTMASKGPQINRPTVVLPHGGPSARDEWGFDWLAQFLASRGYAVIQPQYRGSSGYGDTFEGDNAFKGWRLAMSDIADAADWLVKKGIADPHRMAIVGWSYGGYAALQSAAMDPRYKAVVAIAPVTDFGALRRDAEGFDNADIERGMIGKGPGLKLGSPLYNAAAIKAPVLLIHGDLDNNVRIAHSQRMNAALRRVGTPVEFLSYKGLDHQLQDSGVRTEMLTHIGQLLERTIGHEDAAR